MAGFMPHPWRGDPKEFQMLRREIAETRNAPVAGNSRDLRLRSLQAGLDYQTALADLEQAIGSPLP